MLKNRLLKALTRAGLQVTYDPPVYEVRLAWDAGAPVCRVLLPDSLPVEAKAFQQLATYAAIRHPDGYGVLHACATPDLHPGPTVPVGAVIATPSKMVIPQAIGGDIACGMRLHAVDLSVDEYLSKEPQLTSLLRGDLLLGTRDLPMTPQAMTDVLMGGIQGWLSNASTLQGQLSHSSLDQLCREVDRIYDQGSLTGHIKWAPEGMYDTSRDTIRDPDLGTVGGGNHFVEVQVVDEVCDGPLAWQWGLKAGRIAYMIHTGSRGVGQHVGSAWSSKVRSLWPSGVRHPINDLYPLAGDPVDEYLQAMYTASNYAYLNRLVLGEIVRLRMREVYGDLEAPLVYDLPHNLVCQEGGLNIHRKGATPAHQGQPVLIPGSMGHPSWVLVGQGHPGWLSSASHGAGRLLPRHAMGHVQDLGLGGVTCYTLRAERRVEEAPAAYKPIGPVVDVQIQAGLVRPVARLRPLATYKS